MKLQKCGALIGFVFLLGLVLLVGAGTAVAATIYPANYSFENTVVTAGPGKSVQEVDSWATSGATSEDDAYTLYPKALIWQCYPPTDGIQTIYQKVDTTVYQQLSDVVVAGTKYILKADVGDGLITGSTYHPTYALTLCYGDLGSDISTWTDLVTKTEKLTDTVGVYGSVSAPFYAKETAEYIGAGAAVGKQLGIKLVFIEESRGLSADLQWDNVRIEAIPEPMTMGKIGRASCRERV